MRGRRFQVCSGSEAGCLLRTFWDGTSQNSYLTSTQRDAGHQKTKPDVPTGCLSGRPRSARTGAIGANMLCTVSLQWQEQSAHVRRKPSPIRLVDVDFLPAFCLESLAPSANVHACTCADAKNLRRPCVRAIVLTVKRENRGKRSWL